MDKYDIIRNSSFFKDLNDDSCMELSINSEKMHFNIDDYVNFPGKKCNHVYIIENGLVKGGIYSKNGDELNSGRFYPNNLFGLSSVIDNLSADFFYQAIEETNLIAINASCFSKVLKNNGGFCYSILQLFGKSFLKSIDKRIDTIFYDNKTQIINFLLQQIIQNGEKIGQETLHRKRVHGRGRSVSLRE